MDIWENILGRMNSQRQDPGAGVHLGGLRQIKEAKAAGRERVRQRAVKDETGVLSQIM